MKKYTRPNLTPTPAQLATRARLHAEAKTRNLFTMHLLSGHCVIWNAIKRNGQRQMFTPDTVFFRPETADDLIPIIFEHLPDTYLGYCLGAAPDAIGLHVSLALNPERTEAIIDHLKNGGHWYLSIGTPMQNDGKVKYITNKPVNGVYSIVQFLVDHIALTQSPEAGTQTAITLVQEAVQPPNNGIIQGST